MKLIIDLDDDVYARIFNSCKYVLQTDILESIKAIHKGKVLEKETKQGRWIKISPAGIYYCSVCGQNLMTSDICTYKYCHFCGVRMESEVDNYDTN